MELLCLEKENEPCSVADPVFLDDDRVLNNLLFLEEKYRLKGCYFETVQKDLTAAMRKEVSIWLLEVCMEEQCEEEVFPTALCIMDRFLSLVQIQKSQLQLLATTCLLLSSKLVQNKTITTDRLVMFTDYSVTAEEVRSWEYLVLGELGWDLHAVIPNHFLDLILRRLTFVGANKRTMIQKHAELFISLCASEYQFFNYLPSVIASACLALVLDIHCYKDNLNEILDAVHQITKIESKLIEDTIDLLEDLIPSNRFHSTKNQAKRKRKNQDRQLINLNQDSDSELENEPLCATSSEQTVAMKSCSNQKLTTSLSNCKNSLAAVGGEQCPSSSNQLSQLGSQLDCKMNSQLSSQLNNHLNNQLDNEPTTSSSESSCDNLSPSSLSPVDSEEDRESVLSQSSEENDLMLIDLTCFETAKPLCSQLVEKVF